MNPKAGKACMRRLRSRKERMKGELMSKIETTLQSIASGGTGGEITAVDTMDGKIVRIRPFRRDTSYTEEELAKSMWQIEVDGKVLKPTMKTCPNYFALAYKNRVYSKNRVLKPLKRVDWEPGGDPAKINAANRGKSKFVEISWDEALDIMESELRRIIDTYGPYAVFCVGEDGHRESKDLHAGGGMHANLMDKLGGYTRETRTPDSVEGWYWGAKHVWGCGCNKGLGLAAPVETGYNPWNVIKDVAENSQMLLFDAGDWELTTNYASLFLSQLMDYFEVLGKEMVSVDPFCNYTNVCHNMKWIPVLPNTDAAFHFGVFHTLITEGLYDKDYIETHAIHFDKLVDYVMGKEDGEVKDPKWASERCGVPTWTIKAFARNVMEKATAHVHYSSGHIKTPYSHEPARTSAYLMAMQGLGKPGVQQLHLGSLVVAKEKIGRSTSAPFTMAIQCRMFYPSAQTIPRTLVAEALQKGKLEWWGSPSIVYVETSEQFQKFVYPTTEESFVTALGTPNAAMANSRGITLEELEAEYEKKKQNIPRFSKVHMLWSEKPCNMNCWDGGFNYQDAIRTDEVEFFVTNHQWLENDSLFADLVLPVTTCLEDNDDMGSSQTVSMRHAGLTPPAIEPRGESMSDFHIAATLGERFGVREAIDKGMSDDMWLEVAFQSSRLPEEIEWEDYKERGYYYPQLEENWEDMVPGMRNFYEDPEAYPLDTPSGKLEFWSQALADNFPDDKERQPLAKWIVGGPAEEGWTHDETFWGERCKKYPLLVTANPAKWRVHVQGDDIKWFREIETCKVKGKDSYLYEPVWIAPEDAEARGIKDGDICKVYNDRGTILCGARISERVAERSVVIAKGSRVDPIAPHLDRGGAANLICPQNQISKHCKGFAVTGYLAEVQKVTDEEYEGWKRDYPEAFERKYDPATGITRDSWIIEK